MSVSNPFSGVDHQVFVTTDMAGAIDFWETQLGISLTHRMSHPEAGVDQAFFSLEDGTFIEILAATKPTSPVTRIIEKHGEGLYVLAMKVKDLTAAIDTLTANGAELNGVGTDRVLIKPTTPGAPMIQLWPEDRPHRWRDNPTT